MNVITMTANGYKLQKKKKISLIRDIKSEKPVKNSIILPPLLHLFTS